MKNVRKPPNLTPFRTVTPVSSQPSTHRLAPLAFTNLSLAWSWSGWARIRHLRLLCGRCVAEVMTHGIETTTGLASFKYVYYRVIPRDRRC
jgi:hypothetical protein